jgi:hypothetical protein
MSTSFSASRFGLGLAPVAHACNPRYSGVRDQEYNGLKAAQENSSRDYLENAKKGQQSDSSGRTPA